MSPAGWAIPVSGMRLEWSFQACRIFWHISIRDVYLYLVPGTKYMVEKLWKIIRMRILKALNAEGTEKRLEEGGEKTADPDDIGNELLIVAEGDHGIEARGAAGGDVGGG